MMTYQTILTEESVALVIAISFTICLIATVFYFSHKTSEIGDDNEYSDR